MARFFFNVHDGSDRPDREGTELPDLAAARHAAVRFAAELLRDHPDEFWNGEDWSMDVADADGLLFFTLMFSAFDAPSVRATPR